ncbi:hypothetical protein BASA84_000589 [Batrachochytrium salamandrivorans]|nr:hypothetical protein BASA84_000589 [Batrachochytrium salamandrivorans]
MQFSGSQITRLSTVHGRSHSSIDHFVCNAPARALLTSPRVDRQTAVADHFVIRTSIQAEAQGQPPAPRAPTISRHHCLEATDRIATSNYWDVLADGAADDTDTDTDIHQLTSQFLESANAAAATQLEKVDGRKQWVKHADNLDRAVSDGRTDLVFAASRAMSGNRFRSAAVTPLYNSNGIVQYDPTSILRVMQGHYGSLAADTTGHSLDLQYWHDRQPIQVSLNTPTIRNSDILDQDFSWNQIAAALLQMSPRKAPADDGITTAFYQAALYMPANTQEGVPSTPFARALLRKDGDPLNPGDKRGIALINVGLKLVCKVLQMRIERFVETNNLLSYEQAGFRKREECVGQVVSLVDIIQRRTGMLDKSPNVRIHRYPKGIDQSQLVTLFWNSCRTMGFPRRTLPFSRHCTHPHMLELGQDQSTIGPFPVQRGVKNRESLYLDCCYQFGSVKRHSRWCSHPSRPWDYRETPTPSAGLMSADDVAVFADSEQSLLAASTAVEQWAISGKCSLVWPSVASISFTGHLAPKT